MRQNSVDGITNFDNIKDRFKFDTRHLNLTSVDRRGLPAPKRRLVSPANNKKQHHNSEKPAVLPAKTTIKPANKPDLPRTAQQSQSDSGGMQNVKNKRFWHNVNNQKRILLGMASLVFIVGIGVTGYGIYLNKKVSAVNQPSQQPTTSRTVASPGEDPSEEPVSDQAKQDYEVPPDHPRMLMIPKLWLSARVINLGVDKYGNLETPYSVWDTGWYRDSAKPGSEYGATLIDGHVSGLYGQGIFHQLDNLDKGDEIIIERGDKSEVRYKVITKEVFKKDNVDMKKAIKSADLTKHGLNIITCDGDYIAGEQTYSHRLLVRAVVVE